MVTRLRNGEVELYESVSDEGLEVEMIESDEDRGVALVEAQNPVPEAGIDEGDESWVEIECLVGL